MPLRYNQAINEVEADRNRICLTRGPLVYCAEAVDNSFPVRQAFIESLPESYQVKTIQDNLMKGIDFVTISAKAVNENREAEDVKMTLLPYYAWNNRSDDAMIVWIPQTKTLAEATIEK
jgi:DUF1680 family protein